MNPIENEIFPEFIALVTEEEDEEKLRCVYSRIHGYRNRLYNLLLVIESDVFGIDEENKCKIKNAIYDLESSLHGDDSFKIMLCLKNSLGTSEITIKFFDGLKFGFIKKFMSRFTKLLFRPIAFWIIHGALFLVKMAFYYFDLIKDIFLVIFISEFTTNSFDSLADQLMLLLIADLIILEMANFALVVSSKNKLKASTNLHIALCCLSPFVPAICLFQESRFKIRQRVLAFRFSKANNDNKNYKRFCDETKRLEREQDKWRNLLWKLRRNENFLEHFPQGMILLLVLLLSRSETSTADGMQTLFSGQNSRGFFPFPPIVKVNK